jgi:hypothetical protein
VFNYLLGTLKDGVYVKNAHLLEELKFKDKLTAYKDELCSVLRNIFERGEVCLQT